MTALIALVGIILTGCGGGGSDTTGPKPDTAVQAEWKKFAEVTDQPPVDLKWRSVAKPPSGFEQADVDAFARTASTIIDRSFSPEVARMKPEDAAALVFKDLYPATRLAYADDIPADLREGAGWQWFIASTYKPSEELLGSTKIFKVDWYTGTHKGNWDDGTEHPILDVGLRAFGVQQVGTKDHPKSIVVKRTIWLSGFQPRGGSDWWPLLGTATTPFGNDGCTLDQSLLVPLRSAKAVRKDLVALKTELATPLRPMKSSKATAKEEEAGRQKFWKACKASGAQ